MVCPSNNQNKQHLQCYACVNKLLSQNDLQNHLREQCYPKDMRENGFIVIKNIQNLKQRQRLRNILWKHRKLFDLQQPPIIKATVHHAIGSERHPPICTSSYRVSLTRIQEMDPIVGSDQF